MGTNNEEIKESVKDKPKKEKSGKKKYAIYIAAVLIATSLSLFLTLRGHGQDIISAFSRCDWKWIGIIVGVMLLSIFIDGLVIATFMKLFTKKYHVHQGMAVSLIGTFYGGITPGSKGGQVMQAQTLKKQGTQISNAASLLVMYFILYHFALIIFDVLAVIFKSELMTTLTIQGHIINWHFTIPLAPLTIIGFCLNVSIIGVLILVSYSHRMHNFAMHYGVGALAKLKIVKNPDQTRESWRIQIENFKVEFRHLLKNFRVTIFILILLFIGLVCKFSIPWFAGMALNAYDATGSGGATVKSFWDACFMSGYHQMITGLFPIPGGAGVNELFFSSLFDNYYAVSNVNYTASVLLIWRSATYYVMVVIAAFVTFFYKASPKEESYNANRKAYMTMQLETYEERKKYSTTIHTTSQASRRELQLRLKDILAQKPRDEIKTKKSYKLDDSDINEVSPFVVDDELLPISKPTKKGLKKEDPNWRTLNTK